MPQAEGSLQGRNRSFGAVVTRLAVLLFLIPAAVGSVLQMPGCASTEKHTPEQRQDDTAITAKVKAALLQDQTLRASRILVQTRKGIVELSGVVDNRENAVRATDLAASVAGVVSVKNDLLIR